jgi:abortive infection bacteriophage resistance protein
VVGTPADGIAALRVLERVDYYRLLGYMRAFQSPDPLSGVRHFLPDTTLHDVLAHYEFDRKLRLLCMDAVERIEVSLRAAIVSEIAVAEGAHFYLDPRYFKHQYGCDKFQEEIRKEEGRSRAIRHYKARYSTPAMPPIWVAMEAVTFGTVSHLFSNLRRPYRRRIASQFTYDEHVLQSWFRSVNGVRNLAAHHGRLWNAPLQVDQPQPGNPFGAEFNPQPSTFFDRAVVIVALLRVIEPGSDWKPRLIRLLDTHPFVDHRAMGFPQGWRDRPFWAVPVVPLTAQRQVGSWNRKCIGRSNHPRKKKP